MQKKKQRRNVDGVGHFTCQTMKIDLIGTKTGRLIDLMSPFFVELSPT